MCEKHTQQARRPKEDDKEEKKELKATMKFNKHALVPQ